MFCLIVTEEHTALYEELLTSKLQITESCEDLSEMEKAVDTITRQLSLHLTTLCTNALVCNGSLAGYACVPNATYSTLLLKYRVNINAVTGLVAVKGYQPMLRVRKFTLCEKMHHCSTYSFVFHHFRLIALSRPL